MLALFAGAVTGVINPRTSLSSPRVCRLGFWLLLLIYPQVRALWELRDTARQGGPPAAAEM